MNDYDKAIGVWEHKIGKGEREVEFKIIPAEGDNLLISKMMKGVKANGIDWLYQEFNKAYLNMVVRDNSVDETDVPKIRLLIELNQVQIQKDMLVQFGWQTKEQQDKIENMDNSDLKNLIDA